MKSELGKIPKKTLVSSDKWGYNIIGYTDNIELEYFEEDGVKDTFRIHPLDAVVLFEEGLKIAKQAIQNEQEDYD
jgi:hypothetical protein